MATVIAFPLARVRPAAARALAELAQVVIFPGVRVERREFNLADRVPVTARKRRPGRARAAEAPAED